jgi:serine protease inhibitor
VYPTVVNLPVRVGAVLLTGALLLAGCGESAPPGDAARIDAKLVADLQPEDARVVGDAVNAFGFELMDQVGDGEPNTIVSPLSVAVLLAMVLAGADGDTAAEMAKVLHLDNRRDVRVGALLRRLSDTDQVTLSVANALWADQGRPFEDEYLTFVRRTFGATVEQGDLASQEAADAIDGWVDDNTNGLIRDIAADLGLPDADTVLVLLNAVYFLGEWTTRFDRDQTRPAPFTDAEGRRIEVSTMHLNGQPFAYTQRDGYRMLRLPYGEDGRYGMEILLPDEGKALADLLGSLDASQWRAAVDSLAEQTVDELALPRFELRWKGKLNDALQRLGMRTAFTPGQADLRPMSPLDLWLERVVHKTYVRVDESGTEAAAVTGGAVRVTSAQANQTVFRVDRPFAFTISDQQTGTILFLGAVTDPSAD